MSKSIKPAHAHRDEPEFTFKITTTNITNPPNPGIICDSYLYCIFWKVKLICELTPLWSADVVLLDKLLLQPGDLLPGEGRPVAADVVQGGLVLSRQRGPWGQGLV